MLCSKAVIPPMCILFPFVSYRIQFLSNIISFAYPFKYSWIRNFIHVFIIIVFCSQYIKISKWNVHANGFQSHSVTQNIESKLEWSSIVFFSLVEMQIISNEMLSSRWFFYSPEHINACHFNCVLKSDEFSYRLLLPHLLFTEPIHTKEQNIETLKQTTIQHFFLWGGDLKKKEKALKPHWLEIV